MGRFHEVVRDLEGFEVKWYEICHAHPERDAEPRSERRDQRRFRIHPSDPDEMSYCEYFQHKGVLLLEDGEELHFTIRQVLLDRIVCWLDEPHPYEKPAIKEVFAQIFGAYRMQYPREDEGLKEAELVTGRPLME